MTIKKDLVDLNKKVKAISRKLDGLLTAMEKSEKAKTVKKPVGKRIKKQEVKTMTAADAVFGVISRSKKGVNTATIMEKTGYNQKKVANFIYRLKKQGKIKSTAKGVYVKV